MLFWKPVCLRFGELEDWDWASRAEPLNPQKKHLSQCIDDVIILPPLTFYRFDLELLVMWQIKEK